MACEHVQPTPEMLQEVLVGITALRSAPKDGADHRKHVAHPVLELVLETLFPRCGRPDLLPSLFKVASAGRKVVPSSLQLGTQLV